jgi:hypothetical protein
MQFIKHTTAIVFVEWLRRRGHTLPLPIPASDYPKYDTLVEEFLTEGSSQLLRDELKSNRMFQSLIGQSRNQSSFYDRDLSFVDSESYEASDRDVPSPAEFIARYLQVPNHAIIVAAPDSPADLAIIEYVQSRRPFNELLGDRLDVYIGVKEIGYDTLERTRLLPGGDRLRTAQMPLIFIWSSEASAVVELGRFANEPAYIYRRIVDLLRDVRGPLDSKSAQELEALATTPMSLGEVGRAGETASAVVDGRVQKKGRFASWFVGAVGAVVIGVITAWLGNLAGLRTVACDVKLIRPFCDSVFVTPDTQSH